MKKPETLTRYTNSEVADIAWNDLSEVEDAMKDKRKAISETKPPKSQVKRRPDGMDYVDKIKKGDENNNGAVSDPDKIISFKSL